MKSYNISQYEKAGCPEIMDKAMIAVWGITGGKVCDTGCHRFNDGKCPAYKKLISTPLEVKKPKYAQTNKEFARSNTPFYDACTAAGIEPTARQASKFRRGTGIAYKTILSQKNKIVAATIQP